MLKFVLLLVLLIAGAGIFAAMRSTPPPQPRAQEPAKFEPLYDVPAFELTDQKGNKLSNHDLLGKIWIADFIFTRCAGPCPVMTSKMGGLQKSIVSPDVRLVSFSVDPEHDTPPVLKEYAKQYDADESRWSFLTGTSDAIFEVARGMKIAAQAATKDSPILHSDLFLLVNRKGQVVGIYHNSEADEMQRLATDAAELAKK
jgi:cytochrome oxidase Cu insertion factor (SCO1/SenC/PrrC family)